MSLVNLMLIAFLFVWVSSVNFKYNKVNAKVEEINKHTEMLAQHMKQLEYVQDVLSKELIK